ncbi:MAG TPA: hypothetical protein PKN48_10405 [Bacteroidales bacterium]|nr:hypothetical protein [Bacteroidales bacterium]
MNDKFYYYAKKPKDCDESEICKFYELVIKGCKVQKEGLRNRIINCNLLGFCSVDNHIIAISSIKQPQKSYVEKVVLCAQLDRNWQDLKFEIGYSFTEKIYRRKGINSEIKKLLLDQMKDVEGIIFSTTAIESSQNFLSQHGFVNIGQPFDGKNDKAIKYYERK